MEAFNTRILRKTFRMAPKAKRLFEEHQAKLRADRVANPPGKGNLRQLKTQADRDAMHQTYEAIASDAQYAEEAKIYDRLFVKEHGAAAVKAGA